MNEEHECKNFGVENKLEAKKTSDYFLVAKPHATADMSLLAAINLANVAN